MINIPFRSIFSMLNYTQMLTNKVILTANLNPIWHLFFFTLYCCIGYVENLEYLRFNKSRSTTLGITLFIRYEHLFPMEQLLIIYSRKRNKLSKFIIPLLRSENTHSTCWIKSYFSHINLTLN